MASHTIPLERVPNGTVTFLFTDIEGSTRLAHEFPAQLSDVLTRHHTILREAIERHGGVVFQIVGDAFCAAFPLAAPALEAALAAQRALQSEAWGVLRIKVRMGLHTGDVDTENGQNQGYLTLSFTQRLMSLAAGGQVLISATTETLVHSRLPNGVTLRDLGAVQPKDFPVAEHVFQMCAPDLRTDFPPLQPLGTIPNNLPLQLTSLIGREPDIVAVRELLQQSRMVTLTGAGGTGKTRLLLAVAETYARDAAAERRYPDGVWFVELAPLSDAALVSQTVAAALGVREQPGRPLRETLGERLRGQQVLLCLDNCEHLLDAIAQLADGLLRAAARLGILASSREGLGLSGESAYRVPSLEVPTEDVRQTTDGSGRQIEGSIGIGQLMQYAAIRLFVERAMQVNASFHLTEANARAVVQICERLDGIPLAIELAAARVKALAPEQIAARLDDRFRLLNAGTRAGLARHQTLGALIDWSYNLLSEPERVLLRRLSLFAGGWTLEAAEAVCSSQYPVASSQMADDSSLATEDWRLATDDVLDLLSHLVEKSLVMVEMEQDETRYWMLETIRQYARERLRASGESEPVRTRHAQYYREWASAAEPQLRGAEQRVWWPRVETELDNLRAAIDWSLHGGAVSDGATIVCALWIYWFVRGSFSEAHALLDEILARPELAAPSRLRALVLNTAGSIHARMPDGETSAPPLFDEALRIAHALNDAWNIGVALTYLSQAALGASDYATAEQLSEQGLALWRAEGDAWFTGMSLLSLGDVAKMQGNLPLAQSRYQESVDWLRQVNEQNLLANPVRRLGYLALRNGEAAQASAAFAESLRLNREIGERLGVACCLGAFAAIAVTRAQWARAARLYGAMQAQIGAIRAAPPPNDQIDITFYLELLHAQMPGAEFEAAHAAGRALTLAQAIALALGSA